jgi:hypothetical protein
MYVRPIFICNSIEKTKSHVLAFLQVGFMLEELANQLCHLNTALRTAEVSIKYGYHEHTDPLPRRRFQTLSSCEKDAENWGMDFTIIKFQWGDDVLVGPGWKRIYLQCLGSPSGLDETWNMVGRYIDIKKAQPQSLNECLTVLTVGERLYEEGVMIKHFNHLFFRMGILLQHHHYRRMPPPIHQHSRMNPFRIA